VEQVRAIENELRKYDPAMLEKPRWLVLNKADLLDEEETAERVANIVKRLEWDGPHFVVSAISREGTRPIMLKVQQFFDDLKHAAAEAAEDAQWAQRNAATPGPAPKVGEGG
ncbi:MAG TPA: GTPase ObgE, partial [Xanthomonadaceae bacterium]|nr:GTPase ObgE [Xanthomonadaceae bacterium]